MYNIYVPQKQIDEIERNVNKIVANVNKEKTATLLAAARKVQKRIKEKAPRGPTGNLKKATYAKALPETLTRPSVAFAGIRARKAPHAHLLEFGTVKMPPHPFIRPAWDSIKEEIGRDLENAFKRGINGGF